MLRDLPSADGISSAADRLLRSAGAYGRFPTPIDDIVAAAGLSEPAHSLLAPDLIRKAPAHIRKALAFVSVKVRALLDRRAREIHLQPLMEHSGQRAFKRVHEVGHDVLPWQHELVYVDGDASLSWSTQLLFEREANQTAAELFFQRELFARVASGYTIGITSIVDLAQKFGASIHSTFRRYVETHPDAVAGLVFEQSPSTLVPLTFRRHEALGSSSFNERFGDARKWPIVLENPPFDFLPLVRTLQRDVVEASATLGPTKFRVELFSNSYTVFALIWLPSSKRRGRRVTLVS